MMSTALLLDPHQSPGMPTEGRGCHAMLQLFITQRTLFREQRNHFTKIVPVFLLFPLIAVSPCLD